MVKLLNGQVPVFICDNDIVLAGLTILATGTLNEGNLNTSLGELQKEKTKWDLSKNESGSAVVCSHPSFLMVFQPVHPDVKSTFHLPDSRESQKSFSPTLAFFYTFISPPNLPDFEPRARLHACLHAHSSL